MATLCPLCLRYTRKNIFYHRVAAAALHHTPYSIEIKLSVKAPFAHIHNHSDTLTHLGGICQRASDR